jgi:hypothetical protein
MHVSNSGAAHGNEIQKANKIKNDEGYHINEDNKVKSYCIR